MSLHPRDLSVVPEETAQVARAAFPKGNPYLTLRDELGVIYEDRAFALLFSSQRGTRPDRLEVPLGSGTDGSRVRLYVAARVLESPLGERGRAEPTR